MKNLAVKQICILIVLFVVHDLYSQSWIKQPAPTNLWLNKCSFTDSLNGWAGGEEGVIIHTSNGGVSWNMQNSGGNYFIYDIFFLNSSLGWAVANDNFPNGTQVLKTTDGGQNWSGYRYPDSTFLLYSVYYKDPQNGYMGGYGGAMLRTTNGGANWSFMPKDSSALSYLTIYKISFINNNTGYASGGNYDRGGIIWQTTNSGLNWHNNIVTGEPLFCFDMIGSSKVVAAGGDFEFGMIQTTTSNAGATWENRNLFSFGITTGIAFRTASEGWAAISIFPKFAYTLDSGNSWNMQNVPDTSMIFDIRFTDPRHGWAVGTKGAVYKYNASAIGISNNQNEVPQKFVLHQNYPNPFNPVTKIIFDIPDKGLQPLVQIKIFDVLGCVVVTLIDKQLSPGSYTVDWDAADFPSGIYFYKLIVKPSGGFERSAGYTETKKMVLLK